MHFCKLILEHQRFFTFVVKTQFNVIFFKVHRFFYQGFDCKFIYYIFLKYIDSAIKDFIVNLSLLFLKSRVLKVFS